MYSACSCQVKVEDPQKRQAYILSSAIILDWRRSEAPDMEKVTRRRSHSEPPKLEKLKEEKEEKAAMRKAYKEELLATMTRHRRTKVKMDLFAGVPEIVAVRNRHGLFGDKHFKNILDALRV
eukprot:symbB.v1.2.041202.t1/scaffold7918.1/size8697/2